MPQLVIGLGNPGGAYRHTRHNVGWMVLDELEKRGRFGGERREGPAKIRTGSVDGFDIVTARPQTYMNLSGRAGTHLVSRFGVSVADTIVVHDDVDLPYGRLRLRRSGSAGGNRGVDSLIRSWQTKDFLRVRVGVGRPPEGWDTADYVLERFTPEERERLPAIVDRAASAVVAIIREGIDKAGVTYNGDIPAPAQPDGGDDG